MLGKNITKHSINRNRTSKMLSVMMSLSLLLSVAPSTVMALEEIFPQNPKIEFALDNSETPIESSVIYTDNENTSLKISLSGGTYGEDKALCMISHGTISLATPDKDATVVKEYKEGDKANTLEYKLSDFIKDGGSYKVSATLKTEANEEIGLQPAEISKNIIINYSKDEGICKFSIADKKGRTNISDVSFSASGFKFINEDKSSIEIKKGSTVIESKKIADNGTYKFDTETLEDGSYKLHYLVKTDAGYVKEDTVDFLVDSEAPSVSVSFSPEAQIRSGDYSVIAIAQDENLDPDNTSIRVEKNGTAIDSSELIKKKTEDKKITFEGTLSDEGIYKVSILAADERENKAEAKTETFEIDKTAPAVEFRNTLKGSTMAKDCAVKTIKDVKTTVNEKNFKSLSVLVKDEDNETVFQVSDAELKNGGYVINENIADGNYVISVRAEDKAGNFTEASQDVIIDSTAPTISFDGIKDRGYTNKDVVLKTKIFDINLIPGNEDYEVRKNGTKCKSSAQIETTDTTTHITEKFTSEGEYGVRVCAEDMSGNETERGISFEIDKTAPTTEISGISKLGYVQKFNEISIASDDKNFTSQNVRVTRNGKEVFEDKELEAKNIVCTRNLEDGNYVITVTSFDRAGNSTTVSKSFIIDSTAPVISYSGTSEGKFENKNVNLGINVKETNYKNDKVNVKITRTLRGKTSEIPFNFNSNAINCTNNKLFSAQGTYKVTTNATDGAGNTAKEKSISFTVDKEKPVIKVEGIKSTYGQYDRVGIKVTIEDDYLKSDKVVLKNNSNGKIISPKVSKGAYANTYTFGSIPKELAYDGNYSLVATSEDKAGNKNTLTKGFTVNRFGSTFKFESKPEKLQKTLAKNVKISEKNLSPITKFDVVITRDGKTINSAEETKHNNNVYTIPKENFAEDGVYKINIISQDAAGNTSEFIKSKDCDYKFTVDGSAPSVYLTGAKDGEIYKQESLKVYIEAEDALSGIESVRASVNGTPAKVEKEGDRSYVTIHSGFNQNVEVTATDKAGNLQTAKLSKVTVSTGLRATVMQHKLLTGLLGGGVLLGGLLIFLAKRKSDNEDEK